MCFKIDQSLLFLLLLSLFSLVEATPYAVIPPTVTILQDSVPVAKEVPEEEPLFYAAVREAVAKGFVLIEQDYNPVDSFSLAWSFKDRETPLPLRFGIRMTSGILTDSEALKPWLNDPEFRQKAPNYFWVEGTVPDTCRVRTLAGDWRTERVIDDNVESFVYLTDSTSTYTFTRYDSPEKLSDEVQMTALLMRQALEKEKQEFFIQLLTGTEDLEARIEQLPGELYGGATLSATAEVGAIRLHPMSIIFSSNVWGMMRFQLPPELSVEH